MSPAEPTLRPGHLVAGRYMVVREIGRGGMGTVYEGYDNTLERPVALKLLSPELARDREAVARFQREALAVGRIGHPNVCDVRDRGMTDEGVPFIVMELLEGEPLSELLARRGRLPPDEAVELLGTVLAALHAAHRRGILHRDLKPANVFLARGPAGERVPKLVDFGIAKNVEAVGATKLTRAGTILGTPEYMSPEQARGRHDIGVATDVWAAGVMAYEALTGEMPFSGDNALEILHKVCDLEPLPPRRIVGTIPAELESVVLRALAKEPADRYPDAASFAAALLDAGGVVGARPSGAGLDGARAAAGLAPTRHGEAAAAGLAPTLHAGADGPAAPPAAALPPTRHVDPMDPSPAGADRLLAALGDLPLATGEPLLKPLGGAPARPASAAHGAPPTAVVPGTKSVPAPLVRLPPAEPPPSFSVPVRWVMATGGAVLLLLFVLGTCVYWPGGSRRSPRPVEPGPLRGSRVDPGLPPDLVASPRPMPAPAWPYPSPPTAPGGAGPGAANPVPVAPSVPVLPAPTAPDPTLPARRPSVTVRIEHIPDGAVVTYGGLPVVDGEVRGPPGETRTLRVVAAGRQLLEQPLTLEEGKVVDLALELGRGSAPRGP